MNGITTPRMSGYKLTQSLEQLHQIDRRVRNLQTSLMQAQMIDAYGTIAQEHFLSAPVVATMRSTPGFTAAVRNFPDSKLFNIIPEHKTSVRQSMGLESLGEAQGEVVSNICKCAGDVVSAVNEVLTGLDRTAVDFQEQIRDVKEKISDEDITDEMIATIPVDTLSDEGFSKIFELVEKYLSNLEVFDVDHLRANPERIKEEIDGLTDIVGDLGRALGIGIGEQGLVEEDRDEEFQSEESTIERQGLSKATLLFYLDRADGLCDELRGIAARQNEIVGSLNDGATEIPEQLESDDVTYGASEHITLFCCYASLNAKLIRETIILVSRLLTTAGAVIDSIHNDEVGINEPVGG